MITSLRSLFLIAFALSTSMLLGGKVYESLEYGDSREQVIKKLMACERVENSVPKTMFGRVGLNGTFRIHKDLNGLKFALYFDWDDQGGMDEVTLRSDGISGAQFSGALTEHFHAAASLTTRIYGKPLMQNGMPPRSEISDGSIINSFLWHVDEGSLLLGISQTQDKYHISIRFTKERIQPVHR